jgi:hypothetical protein
MFQLFFYVPVPQKEQVKSALFALGAGKLGNYQQCSFEVTGVGQFFPMQGSHPTLGTPLQLTQVEEVKVEMLVADHLIDQVIAALKKSHPYEEPAWGLISLMTTKSDGK